MQGAVGYGKERSVYSKSVFRRICHRPVSSGAGARGDWWGVIGAM